MGLMKIARGTRNLSKTRCCLTRRRLQRRAGGTAAGLCALHIPGPPDLELSNAFDLKRSRCVLRGKPVYSTKTPLGFTDRYHRSLPACSIPCFNPPWGLAGMSNLPSAGSHEGAQMLFYSGYSRKKSGWSSSPLSDILYGFCSEIHGF